MYREAAVISLADEGDTADIPQKALNDALKKVYGPDFDPKAEIEENLFEHSLKALNDATEKGFGSITYGHPDYDFLQRVKYNNAVFAAHKTHRQQNDLVRLIPDENGHAKSFAQFAKDAEGVIGNYNSTWLQTEQATALKRSRIAVQFLHFGQEKEAGYPNLKWLPSVAVNPREAHRPFYNRVWAMDDPFWNSHRPGDEWGCLCGLKSTDEPVTDNKISKRDMPAPSPGLDNNPAEDAMLFSQTHPYIKNGYGAFQERQALATATADKVTIRQWAEEVQQTHQSRGRTIEVGKVDKKVKTFLKKQGITVSNDPIILSDKAIQHMLRAAKKAAPDVGDIANIKKYLAKSDVYYDTGKKNLVYFYPVGQELVKFAVIPNYVYKVNGIKTACNYVITGGKVDLRQLSQSEYLCIKKYLKQ